MFLHTCDKKCVVVFAISVRDGMCRNVMPIVHNNSYGFVTIWLFTQNEGHHGNDYVAAALTACLYVCLSVFGIYIYLCNHIVS